MRDVVALAGTTAKTIIRTLIESEIPAVSDRDIARFALVMVYPTREVDGSLTHLMRTLHPHERPIKLVNSMLVEMEEMSKGTRKEGVRAIGMADSTGGCPDSSDEGAPGGGREANYETQYGPQIGRDKGKGLIRDMSPRTAFTREQLLDEHLLSWVLKDTEGPPLDFPGYLSGPEASDDETSPSCPAASWFSDQAGISKPGLSGYLLKRSSRDPCLWRRRWCVLGEDKFWYMKAKHRRSMRGKAASIALMGMQVLDLECGEGESRELQRVAPLGVEVQTADRVFVFRALSREQQGEWVQAMRRGVRLATENEWLAMAELVVGEEEKARERRIEGVVERAWAACTERGRDNWKFEDGVTKGKECNASLNDEMGVAGAEERHPKTRHVPSARLSVERESRGMVKSRARELLRAKGSNLLGKGGINAEGKIERDRRGKDGRRMELSELLGFAIAVQEYREVCRLGDGPLLASSLKMWAKAQAVYDVFLRRRVRLVHDLERERGATGGLLKEEGRDGSVLPEWAGAIYIERQLLEYAACERRQRGGASLSRGAARQGKKDDKRAGTAKTKLRPLPRLLNKHGDSFGADPINTAPSVSLECEEAELGRSLPPPPKELFDETLQELERSAQLIIERDSNKRNEEE